LSSGTLKASSTFATEKQDSEDGYKPETLELTLHRQVHLLVLDNIWQIRKAFPECGVDIGRCWLNAVLVNDPEKLPKVFS
jgi:hypothetical protein